MIDHDENILDFYGFLNFVHNAYDFTDEVQDWDNLNEAIWVTFTIVVILNDYASLLQCKLWQKRKLTILVFVRTRASGVSTCVLNV